MSLRAHVRTDLLDVEIAVAAGEVVALVGPNGAGKTSLVRALAGLLRADGSVCVGDVEIATLPPADRRVGWLPQVPSLFGHLTARDNAAFSLRARGVRRGPARASAQGWLQRLGVGELGDRLPHELSGGEAARVALARALAAEPSLLLLDEPLAALDNTTRDEVRRLLRSTLAGGPAAVLVVTHDPVDVVALADRVVVLEAGRVLQTGTPTQVAAAPRSPWVASLLGQNSWRGTTSERGLLIEDAHIAVAEPLEPGLPALALCEPSAVTLHRVPPEGSARTVLHGRVLELRSLGGRVRVAVASAPPVLAEVTGAAAADLDLAVGTEVWAAVKATEVRLVRL